MKLSQVFTKKPSVPDGAPKPILSNDRFAVSDGRQVKMSEGNSIFVGGMGSGKSLSIRSVLIDLYERTPGALFFFFDPFKGASDYRALFSSSRVINAVESRQMIIAGINFIHKELECRKSLEQRHSGVATSLSPIYITLEEFHGFSNLLDFEHDSGTPGTDAANFLELLTDGPRLGIHTFASTQVVTRMIPPELLAPFKHRFIFHNYSTEEYEALGLSRFDVDLESRHRGHAYFEGTKIYFPFVSWDDYGARATKAKSSSFILLTAKIPEDIENALSIRKAFVFSDFEERIKSKSLRLLRGFLVNSRLTLNDLAADLGIDKGNLSRLLNGKQQSLTVDRVLQLLYRLRGKDREIDRFLYALEYEAESLRE